MNAMDGTPAPDFRRLFEHLPDLYMILDRELRIVAVTDTYAEATRIERAAVLGRHVFDVFPNNPASADSVANSGTSFRRVLQTGEPDAMVVQRHDVPRPPAEGGGFETRYWSPVNFPLFGADGSVAFIIHRVENVTEFMLLQQQGADQDKAADALRERAKRTEVELYIRTREVAEASTRLKLANAELSRLYDKVVKLDTQKSEFFANVSHELRTPLALILGPVDRLLGSDPDPGTRSDLEVVRRNAAVLLKQVNALLDLSKIEAGKVSLRYARIDVARLVRVVAGHFDGLARQRDVDYRVEAPETLAAEVDPEKVERVLFNLLSNAFKAVPGGGKIRCSVIQEEGRIRLAIADSGPGVAPEDRERIFQRFAQGRASHDRDFGGSGLGLAIAKEFVDLHHGVLTVGEAPEDGAEFTVILPALAPADAQVVDATPLPLDKSWVSELGVDLIQPSAEPGTVAPAVEGQATVLVVEDHPDLRRYLVRALGGRWRVAHAADGAEGLEKARALRPDVIVTDLMMPRMSGDEMIARLRDDEALAQIPVVVLSAKADDPLRVRLLSASVQDYLVKPFAEEELRARVANLVAMKRTRDVLGAELECAHRDLERMACELIERNRDLKSAAEAMRVARDQAYKALEAKTTFLRLISHELRTPLAALELQLALLRRDDGAPLTGRRKRAVDALGRIGERLSHMIEGVLTLTRSESGRLQVRHERFDLRAVVEDAIAAIRQPASAKNLGVGLLAPGEALACGDPNLVALVVRNLLDNAVKYTEAGRIDIAIEREEDGWTVAVTDTGPGIPVEAQARIFDPFIQLEDVRHKHTPGIGLGLALVRQVVEAMGGTIRLHSQPGRGSMFVFSFPETAREEP